MEIPRWLECMQDRDHPMGKKKNCLFNPAISRHKLDYDAHRLPWSNHKSCLAFQDCLWPMTCTLLGCCVFRPHSQACHVTEITVKPRCFLLPCQTSLSVCRSSQQLDMIWLHKHEAAGRYLRGCCFIHVTDVEACQACLMLMLDVSYLYFCLPLPTRLAVLLNDLTFLPYSEICSISVTHLCENSLSLRKQYPVQTLLFPWSE